MKYVRTCPETWLEPSLGANLSCTYLAPGLNLSYTLLTPDLDMAGADLGRHLSKNLNPPGSTGGGCGIGTFTPAPRSRWLCVLVAPSRRVPRLTSLIAGTTLDLGGTHPNPRSYLYSEAT